MPVSGDFATTEYRLALAEAVPVNGPVIKMSLFSGPKGSMSGGTSSNRYLEAMPAPPKGRFYPEPIQGLCVLDHITGQGIIDEETKSEDALLPFFRDVWDAYGLDRPEHLYGEQEADNSV